jgi:hypothetical protein
MDPLAPATVTLAPAIAHIAETAVGLAGELGAIESTEKSEAETKKIKQQQLVKRAVRGPETLQSLLDQHQRSQAVQEWELIQKILDRCGGVKGSSELRNQCEKIMTEDYDD